MGSVMKLLDRVLRRNRGLPHALVIEAAEFTSETEPVPVNEHLPETYLEECHALYRNDPESFLPPDDSDD